MYQGLVFVDLDTMRPTAADIRGLLARGHDLILLSNLPLDQRLEAIAPVYTVITKPEGAGEDWKIVAIYATARLMNAVKLFLIGNISAPVCQYYTVESYSHLSDAIREIR